jgi:hypothetical protein
MQWQLLLVETYKQTTREFEQVLNGLTPEDLQRRPADGANPIGWLLWHVTRSLDRTVGDVIAGQQLWHSRFNLPGDPQNTGYGHTQEQVAQLRIPDVQTLRDYHQAVMQQILPYLENLTEEELSKEYPFSVVPGSRRPVYARLMANINDLQHIGQAGYVRGLIKGQGWYGR